MPKHLFTVTLAGALIAAAPAPQAAPAEPAASAKSAAPTAPPSIEAFAELPFMESPILSPDGTRIAARMSVEGEQALVIIALDGKGKPARIVTGATNLNGWSWVNDDWLIARAGATSPVEGERWYLRRALGIKADGSKVVPLGLDAGQRADDVLWIARDGTPRVLIAMQTSVYSGDPGLWPSVREYDVSTGRERMIQHSVPNVMNWYADSAGAVRMGISYNDDSRGYRLLYRDGADQPFRTVAKARGNAASLGSVPAMFLPEPGKGLAYSDNDGFDALYDFDLATLKTGSKLFGKPGYDVDDLVTNADRSRVIGIHYTDTAPRTKWFDPALAEIQDDIDKAVAPRHAQIVSWSRDFGTLMIQVGGADQPGSYYVYRPAFGRMRLFAPAANQLKRASYAPVSTIRYTARDGLEIAAVLTLPNDKAPRNLPLIMMPHGGPAARDDESWDWWAQFLASRGYAVLQPNYRGSTGYGTAFQDKGKGQWGLGMQDDLTDAVAWAAKTGLADPKRVCIVGGSYGGYAALRAAERDTGVYRCAVSFAGVSDMPAMLRYDGRFLDGNRSRGYLLGQAPDLKGVSPINFAASFSIPLLMVHGKADLTVPVGQSRDMAARLKAAGKTFRYVEQPKGNHHFPGRKTAYSF